LLACGGAVIVGRRWRLRQRDLLAAWSSAALQELLWWVAAALALRCLFEPVMVAYYVWPVLAVALVTASVKWSRLIPTAVVTSVLTFVSQNSWPGPWIWWGSAVTGLVLTLFFAAPRETLNRLGGARAPAKSPGTGPGRAERRPDVQSLPPPSSPSTGDGGTSSTAPVGGAS
jgi:hypothetical protein